MKNISISNDPLVFSMSFFSSFSSSSFEENPRFKNGASSNSNLKTIGKSFLSLFRFYLEAADFRGVLVAAHWMVLFSAHVTLSWFWQPQLTKEGHSLSLWATGRLGRLAQPIWRKFCGKKLRWNNPPNEKLLEVCMVVTPGVMQSTSDI